ncbi:MAG TPA: right-handed parallel beta-helix repeat-containing protein [Candidatus Polarisedimenticolaceae bacterium]|nr:right-handed parallel beta-helix repeat-containing protein [Candidatus Polarisedimenticolaceae bacterium]
MRATTIVLALLLETGLAPVGATDVAIADLDGDGTLDAAVGTPDGVLRLHRGDPGSLFPAAGRAAAPFGPAGSPAHVPIPVDRLLAGDFDADGRTDLRAAARGHAEMFLLRVDRAGNLAGPERVALPGALTAIGIGELDRVDGLADLAVAVVAGDGAELLLYRGAAGALRSAPESAPLPTHVDAIVLGRLDGDSYADVAVLAGSEIRMLSGRSPRAPKPTRTWIPLAPDGAARDMLQLPSSTLRARRVAAARLDRDAVDDLVTVTEDGELAVELSGRATTFVVTGTADGGAGSLRDAIASANASAGADVIEFAIPGAGPHTITPAIPLPVIAEAVVIDATTQPGYAGTPLVVLDGSGAGFAGLNVTGGSSVIRGLAIGNLSTGIVLSGAGGNFVEACHIGIDPSGTTSMPNTTGVIVSASGDNVVGGTADAAANVISGNSHSGVSVGSAARVEGNRIGTDVTGTVAVPNDHGVLVLAGGATVGGSTPGSGNLIAGNAGSGVQIQGADDVVVQGNAVGVDATGTTPLGNGEGIGVVSSDRATIGGTAPGTGNQVSGNTTSPSSGIGIHVSDSADTLIRGNRIGTSATGNLPLGNNTGIAVDGASTFTEVGGGLPGSVNVIGGNHVVGVSVSGAHDTRIAGNLIGTTLDGLSALGNGLWGVRVRGVSTGTRIGGITPDDRNVVAGSGEFAIAVEGDSGPPTGTVIEGNFIGTDVTGLASPGAAGSGILLADAPDVRIGGSDPFARNVIVGHTGCGIVLFGPSSGETVVQNNLVGLAADGLTEIPNLTGVCFNAASGYSIGAAGSGNVISGSNSAGVYVSQDSGGNFVVGNLIGLDASGVLARPNLVGVEVNGPSTTVAQNTISGNTGSGIWLGGQTADSALVANNTLGETLSGAPAGNLVGIYSFRANNALIANNQVRYNLDGGIVVREAISNQLTANLIADNGGLGIDLDDDGVSPNDPGDVDGGANFLQNFPVLTTVTYCGVQLDTSGTLDSAPSSTYDIELFLSRGCDPSGQGEGDGLYDDVPSLATDAGGSAGFSLSTFRILPAGLPLFASATATGFDGNTSEFSACVPLTDDRPGEVAGVAWPGKTEMTWTPLPGVTGYRVYRGDRATLPALATPESDSSLIWTGGASTTGPSLSDMPAAGGFHWFLVRATGSCGEGSPGSGRPAWRLHDSAGTISSCSHDLCTVGPVLAPDCSPCARQICAADPYCCDTEWDLQCVAEVQTICGSLTCAANAGACAHPQCTPGVALTAGCDSPPLPSSCVAAVCALDGYCCSTEWDEVCVHEVPLICDGNCD